MRLFIMAASLLMFAIPAQAHHRHHRHHYHHQQAYQAPHYHAQSAQRPATAGGASGFHIVTVQTAAGRITVASHLAERFKALIADFVAAGYKPRSVGCYASGGHVPNSRHYHGAACDFDQTGWGRTANFMYHAHAIIVKHGFRDGCSFNDCGHVDDGLTTRYGGRHAHYAERGSYPRGWFGAGF